MNTEIASVNREKPVQVLSGWIMLPVVILLMLGGGRVHLLNGGYERSGSPLLGTIRPGDTD